MTILMPLNGGLLHGSVATRMCSTATARSSLMSLIEIMVRRMDTPGERRE